MPTIDATVKSSKKTKKFKRIYLVAYGDVSKHKKRISANAYSHWHQFEWFIFMRGFCFRDFSLITYFETNLFFFVSSEGVAFHRCQPLSLSYIIYIHTFFSDYTSSIDIKEQLFYLEFILIDTVLTSVLNFSHVPYLPTYLL